MREPKVTVVVPTYNRADLLRVCLESVVAQDYADFGLVVLDNASTDDTPSIVRGFKDSRIRYVRHERNIGLFRNWNRAIEINASPYLTLLQDDDTMLPGFIGECAGALDAHPGAGFVTTRARSVDIHGTAVELDARFAADRAPAGCIDGLEYLHQIVSGKKWIIHFSSIMMRARALAAIGGFDFCHSKDTLDLNLYLRLAEHFDVVFMPRELCQVRAHAGQESRLHYDSERATGPVAVVAERVDAIGYLMRSARGQETGYRAWLADRLLDLSMRRSEMTQALVPTLSVPWEEKAEIVREEIEKLIPRTARFILVDQASLEMGSALDGRVIPFLERDGEDWGAPEDDETAIRELERLRGEGARFIVFAWTAFWWLDYYGGLREYLRAGFRCRARNSRLIMFDLQERK